MAYHRLAEGVRIDALWERAFGYKITKLKQITVRRHLARRWLFDGY